MANQKIEIELELKDKDGSIKKRTNDTKELNSELDKSQKLATGTKTGSQALSSTRPMAAQMVEYGAARGVMGTTGAGARDFAKQAEGLGGLVRLYATWAANIYAVSAAFTALKNAADTQNMIEGMNQLGAQSGVALGSLAKRFVDVTGGAISLREAVSSTTKSISAGLSPKQFLELGQVATKASKALGIDLNDAVNRLTRGIVKLEPELLDELGIYTKIGPATEEYARKVGKTASSLTDFEKRQAFANAVLAEGQQKFAAIKIDANPYDKLSASLKNLEQTALTVVNTVLGPLINFLSQSPTALAAVVGSLGLTLLRQVIPAVSQYRKELDDTFIRSARVAKQKADEVKKIEKAKYADVLQMSEAAADAELTKYEQTVKNLEKVKRSKLSKEAQTILGKQSPADVTGQDIKRLEDIAEEKQQKGQTKAAERYKAAAVALKAWTDAEKEHLRVLQLVEAQIAKDVGAKRAVQVAKETSARAQQIDIIRGAAGTAADVGMVAGFKELFSKTKESDLSGFQKGLTGISGAASILTNVFTGLIGRLAGAFNWIALTVTVFSTLYSWISKNREASQELSKAIEQSNETFKVATQTLDNFRLVLTLDSIKAKSAAIAGLADSIDTVILSFNKFQRDANTFDNIWENIKGIFNLSELDAVAKTVSKSIQEILKNLATPELANRFKTQLEAILNIKNLDILNFADIFKKATPEQQKAIAALANTVKIQNQAIDSSITTLKDSFKAADTAYQNLSNSLIQTDPISNYAKELANIAKTTREAFKTPEVAVATLAELLKDPESAIKRFGVEGVAALSSVKDEFIEATNSIEQQKARLEDLEKTLQRIKDLKAGERTTLETRALQTLPTTITNLKVSIQAEQASLNRFQSKMQEASQKALDKAFDIVQQKAGAAAQQGQIEVQKTIASYLPKSIETIKLQADLERRSIDIRIGEIKAINSLTKQIELDRLQREIDSLEAKKAKESIDKGLETEKQIKPLRNLKQSLEKGTISRDIRVGTLERTPESSAALQREQGFSEQLAGLLSQKDQIKVKEYIDTYLQYFDQANKLLQDELDIRTRKLEADKAATSSIFDQIKLDEEFNRETETLRRALATTQERRQQVIGVVAQAAPGASQELKTVVRRGLEESTRQFAVKSDIFALDEKTKNIARDRKRFEEEISYITQLQVVKLEKRNRLNELNNQSKLQGLETEKAIIEQTIQNTGFTTQAEADRIRQLDIQILQQQKQASLDSEIAKLRLDLLKIDEEIAKARKSENKELEQLLNERRSATEATTSVVIQNINKEYEARVKVRELQKDEGTRVKAYADLFEASFNKMSDAIADFVKTGKLDFKGLINSMLEDILRLELKLQAQELWKSLRGDAKKGTGILGSIAELFGIGGGTGGSGSAEFTNPSSVSAVSGLDVGMVWAKGGVFDQGVSKFAKGGMFTNSIVNQPTLFKFARGTGLMGEAGPEAIMPLRRDGQGNLGVRSTQPKTEIVVNNYSGEPAEARETVDSRGNRRVEVIVGDMTAGEIGRSGSNSQRTITNTFGIKPQLIRR